MAGSMSQPTKGGNKAAVALGFKSQPPVDMAKKAKKAGQRKAIIGTGLASR